MMRLFFSILFILLVTHVKAGTITTWRVYYHSIEIGYFNEFGKKEIVLSTKDIKKLDSITVIFSRDTPCNDCMAFLSITIPEDKNIMTAKAKNTGTPFLFSASVLLNYPFTSSLIRIIFLTSVNTISTCGN